MTVRWWPSAIDRPRASSSSHRRSDFLDREDLDDVAHLDVVEPVEADAALEPRPNLAHVVLETAEAADLPLPDDGAVARQSRLGVAAARDPAVGHQAAGDRPRLRRLEDLLHARGPQARFLERRLEQAGHGLLDLVRDVVDDRVLADVDLLAIRHALRVAIRLHVEADDDGTRGRREQHVRLVDGADAGVDDADLDAVVAQLRERVGQHFGRSLHVGFDDDREILHGAFGHLLLKRLERQPAALATERLLLCDRVAVARNVPRLDRIVDDLEGVARPWRG